MRTITVTDRYGNEWTLFVNHISLIRWIKPKETVFSETCNILVDGITVELMGGEKDKFRKAIEHLDINIKEVGYDRRISSEIPEC